MVYAAIVAYEVLFWVLLLTGLAVRYLARRRRLGAGILASVPLVDLVLLIVTVLHLRQGAPADLADGLAAAYLGASVGFGPSIIGRLDARFAHRFAGGPPAPRPPRYGAEHVRHEWREFRRATVAWLVSCLLLVAGAVYVGDLGRGGALLAWAARLTLVLVIWLIFPVSYQIWPRRAPRG